MKTLASSFINFLLKVFLFQVIFVFSLYIPFKLYENYKEINSLRITDSSFLDSIEIAVENNSKSTLSFLLYDFVEKNKNISSINVSSINTSCDSPLMSFGCKDSRGNIYLKQTLGKEFGEYAELNIYGRVDSTANMKLLLISLGILSVNFLIVLFLFYSYYTRFLNKNLSMLIHSLDFEEKTDLEIKEYSDILSRHRKVLKKLKQSQEETLKLELDTKILKTYKQVAHDIRSPLESLRVLSSELIPLESKGRELLLRSIKRISSIANELLHSSKDMSVRASVNLRMLVEAIIEDKSFEKNVGIQLICSNRYEDFFISCCETSMYRCISNLVNNSIESIENSEDANVSIAIKKDDLQKIQIVITDNGCGIKEENISKILKGGLTTKERGRGLGISYAREIVESLGSKINLESVPGIGTKVDFELEGIKSPIWFTEKLDILTSNVVCIDDDPIFLDGYKLKFNEFQNLNLILATEHELDTFDMLMKDTSFLVDYDFRRDFSGLDFIVQNDLASSSTLVTSLYQDEDIQRKCVELDVKILPKQIFSNSKVRDLRYINLVNMILIDDDELIHMSWKMEAEKAGVKLDCFFTVAEFLAVADNYDKDIVVYIDSNLADGIKGEVESEKIFNAGFENIYLATGYSPSDFDKPNWIKEIVGKRAKFN